MKIEQDVSLKPYNTFGLDIKSHFFTTVQSKEEFIEAWNFPEYKDFPKLILGGGSNVLFKSDYRGLVIVNQIKGIEIINSDENHVFVKFYSGENWHESVEWTLNNNLSGIENLSLIPGTIGAAPMQNIGAYGVELKEVFDSLEAIELYTGNILNFNALECGFGYRESIFKHSHKGKYFIYSVTLKLNKKPNLRTDYGDISQTLAEMKVDSRKLTPKAVSQAVIKIRQSKLPDPKVLGNSGSFFKNPIISETQFNKLQVVHPTIKGFEAGKNLVKVPAAWLIEQSGWKGKRVGNCGSHEKQALVLVNYGNAKGSEIYSLALQIKKSVKENFGIDIEPEVNII